MSVLSSLALTHPVSPESSLTFQWWNECDNGASNKGYTQVQRKVVYIILPIIVSICFVC